MDQVLTAAVIRRATISSAYGYLYYVRDTLLPPGGILVATLIGLITRTNSLTKPVVPESPQTRASRAHRFSGPRALLEFHGVQKRRRSFLVVKTTLLERQFSPCQPS